MVLRKYCVAALPLLATCSNAIANVHGTPGLSEPWHDVKAGHVRHVLQQSEKPDAATTFTGEFALYTLFAIFATSSIGTCISGLIVTLQWPYPNACCFHTPHSDIPSNESCGCCALHRLNIGFAVTWLALLVLLVLAFIPSLMAAAAVLAIIHATLGYRIMRQLKESHAVGLAPNTLPHMQMTGLGAPRTAGPVVVTGTVIDRPLPGVPLPGIPVVHVPLSVALVETQLQTQVNFNEEQAATQRTGANGATAPDSCGPDQLVTFRTAAAAAGSAAPAPSEAASAAPGAAPGLLQLAPPAESAAAAVGTSGGGTHTGVAGSVNGNQMQAGLRTTVPVAAVVDARIVGMQQQGLPQGVSAQHAGQQNAWGESPAWPQHPQ